MSIKGTLTAVAVDSARDYLRERLQEIKKLDLDQDGQKDVDQAAEIISHLSEKIKEALDCTDFQKLTTGLEQLFTGAALVGSSMDRQKLYETTVEVAKGAKQLTRLLQLGVQEAKHESRS